MATRDELVQCGVRLLERDGLAGISLRRIAAEAGVSHGAPRHHFPTYGALLAAIARAGIDDLDAELTPALRHADARDAIARAARVYVEFAARRPEMFTLMHRHDLLDGQGGHLREVTGAWFGLLAARIAEACGDEPRHADPHRAAALWAGVHGLAVLDARRATEPVSTLALSRDTTLDVLLDALLAKR